MASTALASAPPVSSVGAAPCTKMGGPPTVSRQMRLQVSYTFDDTSQSHCLARWPNLVSTPTVQVEPELLVGAVELKTCILSIISASPELVATLSQDFCVYAFDFSEPEFPLVGCGMLSWAMLNAQNSSTRIMITGRVRTNKFGVFNDDGVKETLEVKFRLHKVNTFTQEQFVKSVHTYTALSKMLPGNFDASAWSNFVQAHPMILNTLPPGTSMNVHSPAVVHARLPAERTTNSEVLRWKERGLMAAEDCSQPPKKKQKSSVSKRLPKSTYSRKKSAVAIPSPGKTSSYKSQETSQEIVERASHSTCTLRRPSTSKDLSHQGRTSEHTEQSPSPIASSPPIQSDNGEATGILSPAPTSPCLPSLPVHQACVSSETKVLLEEPETKLENAPVMACSAANKTSSGPLADETISAATKSSKGLGVSQPSHDFSRVKPSVIQKGGLLTSDALMLPDIPPPVPFDSPRIIERPKSKPRTAAHVKERIELQLLEAINNGKMPNYCRNCGAIETAVWRRVRLSDAQPDSEKVPGKQPKHEERDGSEVAITLSRKEKEETDKEVMLCNACGLWFWSHKTMRPQALWDSSKQDAPKPSKSNPRKRKKGSTAGVSSTSSNEQQSLNTIILPDDDPTPRLVKKVATTPHFDRSKTKNENLEWNNAISEGERAAQSSPIIHGSASSPIDLEAEIDGAKSPRRLLFPGSRSPDYIQASDKQPGIPDKENEPPCEDFELNQTNRELIGPKTPTRQRSTPCQFRTPLRSTSRSIIGLVSSPCRSLRRGTNEHLPPATPERRLLKSHQQRISLSPTAGLLQKLLTDDSIVMAEIPNSSGAIPNTIPNLSFDIDDDFMNTDLTMPSSPPQFSLFEDADGVLSDAVTNGDWSDFLPSTPSGFNIEELLEAHKDGHNTMTVDLSAFIEEHSGDIIPAISHMHADTMKDTVSTRET